MDPQQPHWSEDPYWTDASAAFYRRRAHGLRLLTIDLDAIERQVFNGDGPAYRLMNAMVGVHEKEGWEGHKGAPRVLLAALLRLAEISGSTPRIPRPRRVAED